MPAPDRSELEKVLAEVVDRPSAYDLSLLQAIAAAGYRLVPEGERRALEAEWGRYQDALRTIATTTSKWTDCAAIAAAALSDPEVTDE